MITIASWITPAEDRHRANLACQRQWCRPERYTPNGIEIEAFYYQRQIGRNGALKSGRVDPLLEIIDRRHDPVNSYHPTSRFFNPAESNHRSIAWSCRTRCLGFPAIPNSGVESSMKPG
ncbi:MAG: hypothetical protein NT172_11875 [Planctomycetota bacterium]|nr:hypothetical protein [Planctomycetota bacterium]